VRTNDGVQFSAMTRAEGERKCESEHESRDVRQVHVEEADERRRRRAPTYQHSHSQPRSGWAIYLRMAIELTRCNLVYTPPAAPGGCGRAIMNMDAVSVECSPDCTFISDCEPFVGPRLNYIVSMSWRGSTSWSVRPMFRYFCSHDDCTK
jgi:hypothetical protein